MRGNFKALGIAVLATLAMSAVVASSAQALTQGNFTASKYPAVMTGHEEGLVNHFTITAGAITTSCKSVTYEGTISAATTQIEITPHYTECVSKTGVGDLNTTVDLNGCKFLFTAGTTTAAETHGSVHVKCPAGKSIQVTASPCSTDIGEQTLGTKAGEVRYTHPAGAPQTVTADIAVKGIKYTHTDLNFLCPNTNGHVGTDGEFTSNVVIKGYEDLGSHDNPNTPGTKTYKEGAQIPIDVK